MDKYLTLQNFEQTKLEEIKNFKQQQEDLFLKIEKDYQQKIQNIPQELFSYQEELKNQYNEKLQQEAITLKKSTQNKIDDLNHHNNNIEVYAKEIAKLITQ